VPVSRLALATSPCRARRLITVASFERLLAHSFDSAWHPPAASALAVASAFALPALGVCFRFRRNVGRDLWPRPFGPQSFDFRRRCAFAYRLARSPESAGLRVVANGQCLRSRQLRSKNSLSRSSIQAVASRFARCGFAYAIHRDPAPPATFRFVAPCEASKAAALRSCCYQQSVIAATSCACALPASRRASPAVFQSRIGRSSVRMPCSLSPQLACILRPHRACALSTAVRIACSTTHSVSPELGTGCQPLPALSCWSRPQAKLVTRDLLSPRRCHVLSTGGSEPAFSMIDFVLSPALVESSLRPARLSPCLSPPAPAGSAMPRFHSPGRSELCVRLRLPSPACWVCFGALRSRALCRRLHRLACPFASAWPNRQNISHPVMGECNGSAGCAITNRGAAVIIVLKSRLLVDCLGKRGKNHRFSR
jgi:hypothetical protein